MQLNNLSKQPLILPEAELKIDGEIYKLLLDQSGAYIFIKNSRGEYVYVNALTQQLFNRELEDILGYDDSHFFDLDISADLRKNDCRVLELGETVIEKETNVIKETGETRVYQSVKKPIYNNQGTIIGLLGVSTDITEIYFLKEKLKQQSRTDPLTHTLNRQAYNDLIAHHFALFERDGTPFSLILFDIDDFKQINDAWGHQVGDAVLQDLIALIEPHINEADRLFRMGGEEFLILLPGTRLEQAIEIAEQIRHATETSEKIIENHTITISLGVTEVQPGDTEDSLYQRVDALLYKSKHTGKNKVSY